MENAENNVDSTNSKFVEFWVPVPISNVQLEQYCATLLSNDAALRTNSKCDTLGALNDIFVTIRKCCNHPYTVDLKVEQSLVKDKDPSMAVDVGVEASGKLRFLDLILPEIQKQQRKVLILFQPTSGVSSGNPSLGNLLVEFVIQRFGENSYEHVDGVPTISSKKQAAINMFNKDMTKFIFLLESRAFPQSIKLSSVDTIIIFDSELNPSNDLKSLQKLSIDSQSEQIMVFRLYSLSTVEEKILKLAEINVVLDIKSQSLRSNYDALLVWGASDLFDKLTKIHNQTVVNISSEESFLKDVVEEFLYILSHKCKSNDTTSNSIITRVQNTLLHAEVKTHLPDGDQPYIFWKKLLEGQCPAWKFVSQSTPQRQRKRPNYLLEGESDVDGGGVKTRRKTVNNEPAQLKTVTGGVNEGVSAATNKSQSSSGNQFSLTTSMLDLLKPTVSELCNILKFSEDVKIIVDRFLEYVLENFTVGKEHTSLLQALMISLCWIGSSLAKNKIDRSESFALAKKHFKFSCMEEETESVYNKLKLVKDKYLNHVLPHVESAEVAKPAVKEENAEDSIILPVALHANEDHNVSFCSDSGNPVFAAISQDKTPSVHEIKSEHLQLEQLPDSGIQDGEINFGNLQPSGASQLDQIIPDDEPDFPSSTDPTVAENPSDTLPPSEPLLEPTVEDNVTKFYEELKQRLKADCEKEIDEVVAQIRLKYEAKHQEADAAYNSKKMELVTNINRVPMNKGLADAFRSKCQDLTPSVHPVSQVTPTTPTTSRQPPPPGFNMSKLLALHSEEDDPDYMVEEDNPMEDVELDDDPDYIVEEDNSVEDVEMDMSHVKAFVDHGIEEVDEHIDQHNDDLQDDTNVDIDNFDSHSENDDGDFTVLKKVAKRIRKQKRKSPSTDSYNPFYIGQLIEDKEKLHEMVKNYALTSRREVYIAKNEPLRYRVVCMGTNPTLIGVECLEGQSSHTSMGQSKKPKKLCKRKTKPTCPWAVHISRRTILDSWCVKTICHQHQCLQTIEPGLYTMSSIAKEIEPIIESNPEIPLRALQDVIQKKHQVQVSLSKVFRAKMIVTKKLVGDYRDQYGMLRTYCEELLRANPGSTIKIDVEPLSNPSSNTRQFRRVYICYAAMKRGFKICGREILGLDGCFMNGQYPGQILSAVGVDGNNCIYPFAFALVEAETYESWSWFLDSLQNDLDLTCNSNFTFISDRQNGVIPAMKRVFPNAEHRYCLRHIHENIKKQWCGDVFKNLLWKAASVTTLAYFNNAMQDIRDKDPTLHDWLLQMPPQTWSRSHFTSSAQCDILLNNICEEFNKQLIGATDKPVITCLEYIREYMTRRIVNVKKAQEKSNGPLTPYAEGVFNDIKEAASHMNVLMVDSSRYQVSGLRSQCVVNVDLKTCSCRKWDLTGMPCKHAVAVISDMSRNGIGIGIPENWVSKVYWLDTWKEAYKHVIEPITGPDMWTPSECPTTLVPPKHHKQVERPKKMRRKSVEEVQESFDKGGKMTRKGSTTTCRKCGNKGHNCRSCKGKVSLKV